MKIKRGLWIMNIEKVVRKLNRLKGSIKTKAED